MSEISLNVLQAESFQLVDEREEIIAVLASSADKRPNLLLFDKNGKPVVSLGVNASDEPACILVAGNNNATPCERGNSAKNLPIEARRLP